MESAKKFLSALLLVAGLGIFAGPLSSVQAASGGNWLHKELPVRLKIPSIKINAAIQYVGLTASGAMGVPNGRVDVASFDLGPRPGEFGSAVIAGHRGQTNATPTVFDHLNLSRKGDLIYFQESNGQTISFVVRTTHIYSPTELTPEVFQTISGFHLNLVTCDGIWSKAKKAFSKRLVVFADRRS
jgi:LPXTG-site transpeptidase (sortase) family protein